MTTAVTVQTIPAMTPALYSRAVTEEEDEEEDSPPPPLGTLEKA